MRGLRNSRAPISGFDSPSRASRAICRSCGVSSSRVSSVRLRTFSPVARSSPRARSANTSMPIVDEQSCAARSCARASTRRFSRRSHSPKSRWARASSGAAASAEPLDRLAVEPLGLLALAQQRAGAGLDAQRPVAGRDGRGGGHALQRRARQLGPVAPASRPRAARAPPRRDEQLRRVVARLLRGGERLLVAAEAVAAAPSAPSARTGRRCPGRRRCLRDGGVDQAGDVRLAALEGGKHEGAVRRDLGARGLGHGVGLGDQRRGPAELAAPAPRPGSYVDADREHGPARRPRGRAGPLAWPPPGRCRDPRPPRRPLSPASPSAGPPRPATSLPAKPLAARSSTGAAAERPSVKTSENPSSSRSDGRGGPRGRPAERLARDVVQAGGASERAREQRRAPGVEVGLARELRVERLERLRGAQQQRRRVAAAALERTRPRRAAGPGARAGARRAARPRPWPAAAARRRTRPPPGWRRRRRARGPLGAPGRRSAPPLAGGRPPRAARPPRACARPPRARARAPRPRPVPRPPRRGARRDGRDRGPVGRLRQREMGRPALGRGRGAVDGGAHERVAERHALADRQQAVGRVAGRRGRDAEPLGRAQQQQWISERLGRRDEQQQPRLLGERLEPADEALLDPPRQRVRVRAARTRRRAAWPSGLAAARAARADCRASPRRSGRARARRA